MLIFNDRVPSGLVYLPLFAGRMEVGLEAHRRRGIILLVMMNECLGIIS